MKPQYLVIVLGIMLAACPLLYAQKLTPVELKEIRAALREPIPDTARIRHYIKLGESHSYNPFPEMDSALYYCDLARKLSQATGFQWGLASCDALAGDVYRMKGDHDKALELLTRARDRSEKYHLTKVLIEAYLTLGFYFREDFKDIDYLEVAIQTSIAEGDKQEEQRALLFAAIHDSFLGNYRQAIEKRLRALELSKNSDAIYFDAEEYGALGYHYALIGNYEEAIRYGLEAVRISEESHDSTRIHTLANRYNSLANTYYSMKEYEKALVYYRKAVHAGGYYRAYLLFTSMITNVSTTLLMLKRYEEALENLNTMLPLFPPATERDTVNYDMSYMAVYIAMNKIREAIPHFHRVERYNRKSDTNSILVGISLIKYCIAAGRYDEAQQYLSRTRALCKTQNRAVDFSTSFELQFKLDSSRGNYHDAIRHYQRYKAIGDSLANKQRAHQISELEVIYETQKKDHNIRLLTNEAKLRENELQTAMLIRNITVAGVLALMILIALLYNRYQIKQRGSRIISQKNEELQHLLIEKEWLVKEVHHRVKNNLQTIVSLLESQSRYLSNDALHAILDSQNRVHAMSLIHQKLYQQDNDTSINLRNYLHELVHHLKDSLGVNSFIHFHVDVKSIELDVTQSVPVGLIVNEAVTNSIKYAFRNTSNKCNEISLYAGQSDDRKIMLVIADNGEGLPQCFDTDKSGGLGLKLIRGLAEDIGGALTVESNHGLKIQIIFSADASLHRSPKRHLETVPS